MRGFGPSCSDCCSRIILFIYRHTHTTNSQTSANILWTIEDRCMRQQHLYQSFKDVRTSTANDFWEAHLHGLVQFQKPPTQLANTSVFTAQRQMMLFWEPADFSLKYVWLDEREHSKSESYSSVKIDLLIEDADGRKALAQFTQYLT